jgi:hypothetical protein
MTTPWRSFARLPRAKDQPLDIAVSRVPWCVSDPDGDPVYLIAVGETSDNGGTILDLGGAPVFWFLVRCSGFSHCPAGLLTLQCLL